MKATTTIGLLTGLFAPTVPVVHAGNCMTCHGGSDEWVAATMPELPQLTDADARVLPGGLWAVECLLVCVAKRLI